MAAAPDLGSGAVRRVGSSPIIRTNFQCCKKSLLKQLFWRAFSLNPQHTTQMNKRKKRRTSEKMRRYNISLKRPQEEFLEMVKEWKKCSPEREKQRRKEAKREKWKKWLTLKVFREYDIVMLCIAGLILSLTFFIYGMFLCIIGLFTISHTARAIQPLLNGIFMTITSGIILTCLCPILKDIIVAIYKDKKEKKERNEQKKNTGK